MAEIGDRVSMIDRVAQRLAKSARGNYQVNWLTRQGTVHRFTRSGQCAVKWDDRKTLDVWPGSALRKVENGSSLL